MDIVERVKRICITPQTEWNVIAQENPSAGELITSYVVPLAAIGAIAGFVGGSMIGWGLPFVGSFRVPIVLGAISACVGLVLTILCVVILGFIINALAPTFGGEKNSRQALKVAAYSFTPGWVAGIFQILPLLGILAIIGMLYGLYLLYLGLPRLMRCPPDRAVGYTVVVVVCGIIISVVAATITGTIIGAGMIGSSMVSGVFGGQGQPDADVQFSPDTPLGQLQQLGEKLEESGRKMEEAEQRGDSAAQVDAAMQTLGTLFGGGNRVEAVQTEQLKPFVPDTFAGLPKTSSKSERTGMGGLMVAKAEAEYGDGGQRSVSLEVTDSGGVSGLMGLASWANIQGESEDDNGTERTHKVGDRIVHEKSSKRGGSNEYSIIVANRFVVSASGRGVDLPALRSAVSALDLGGLEDMKEIGVQK